METTSGLSPLFSRHACHLAAMKHFTPDAITACFEDGEITANPERDGQYMITGDGITLVGSPDGNLFRVITVKKG